jgi:hypothetical protein
LGFKRNEWGLVTLSFAGLAGGTVATLRRPSAKAARVLPRCCAKDAPAAVDACAMTAISSRAPFKDQSNKGT